MRARRRLHPAFLLSPSDDSRRHVPHVFVNSIRPRPGVVPAGMINVSPNMAIDTEAPMSRKQQDGVLEFLLINHPLDCPVCDKGGEGPLQDQTMAYDPANRASSKRSVTSKSPFHQRLVYLDRERCILCDR